MQYGAYDTSISEKFYTKRLVDLIQSGFTCSIYDEIVDERRHDKDMLVGSTLHEYHPPLLLSPIDPVLALIDAKILRDHAVKGSLEEFTGAYRGDICLEMRRGAKVLT